MFNASAVFYENKDLRNTHTHIYSGFCILNSVTNKDVRIIKSCKFIVYPKELYRSKECVLGNT